MRTNTRRLILARSNPLREPAWSRLVNVTSKREAMLKFMSRSLVGMLTLTVLVLSQKELTVVNIVGPVDLEKLAKLEGTLGIPNLGSSRRKSQRMNSEAGDEANHGNLHRPFYDFCPRQQVSKGDDFDSVVKMIEQFYSVKHQVFPFSRRLE